MIIRCVKVERTESHRGYLIQFKMDGCFSYNEIKALQELIAPSKVDTDSDDDLPQAGAKKLGPGNIGAPKGTPQDHVGPHAALKGEGDDIWHPAEVTATQNPEVLDPRQVPEYELKFKQAVTTENVFLGMSNKTPGSASCEWLSVFVKLPAETREKIELSVESDAIDIRSPIYRLHLPTPHQVDPNASSAKWHSDSSTLEVTLRLIRELDGVNF